jgi:N-acyl-D-glutamate deacylase
MFWMFMDDHDRIINYDGDAWPLPKETFSHPRSNGTFAKILRSYVRERKLMSMQEALRKMCLMPAQTLEGFVPQMKKKGRLQQGMDADIVVFDPETSVTSAPTRSPTSRPSACSPCWSTESSSLMKGELVLDAAPGRPIRRTASATLRKPGIRPGIPSTRNA